MPQNLFGFIQFDLFAVSSLVMFCIILGMGKVVNWDYLIKSGSKKRQYINLGWIVPLIAYFAVFAYAAYTQASIQYITLMVIVTLIIGLSLGLLIVHPQLEAAAALREFKKMCRENSRHVIYDEERIKKTIVMDRIVEVRDVYNIIQVNEEDPKAIINEMAKYKDVFGVCILLRVHARGYPVEMGYHFCREYKCPVVDIPGYFYDSAFDVARQCTLRLVNPPSQNDVISFSEWISDEIFHHASHQVMDARNLREFAYLCNTIYQQRSASNPTITLSCVVENAIRTNLH